VDEDGNPLIMSGVDHPFAIVPIELIGDVAPSAVCVYAVLAECANSEGHCWPSLTTIGKRMGSDRQAARRGVKALEEAGWIVVRGRARGRDQTSNDYLVRRIRSVSNTIPGITSDTGGSIKSDGGVVSKVIHEPDPLNQTQENMTPFDQFWDMYPKKVGKKVAAQKYKAALKNATAAEIVVGLAAYLTSDTVKNGFVKNPATWLHGEHWNDEHSTIAAPDPAEDGDGGYLPAWIPENISGVVPMPDSLLKGKRP